MKRHKYLSAWPLTDAASTPGVLAVERLLVEETDTPGEFVYTLLDRTTGAVVTQLPLIRTRFAVANRGDLASASAIDAG
jgi:hypothetical protein